ncbi:thiazole tautomerase TenI [Bacillus sp. 165]|uniref:thiazole tautomerase TenI n=1 Tax=Bacillus sp. 165 TaxID=1529117 RepID=UPI001ADB59D7|nr:thiazole tautomerase TenI [Bacillus sp. 165]
MNGEFHVISNGTLSFHEIAVIAKSIHTCVDFIHIREKHKSTKELYEGIILLLTNGVPSEKLIINDRLDIALLTGVSRIQLGYISADVQVVKEKFPHMHIGCSVHSYAEAVCAEQKGADSVMYGHIFKTKSKQGIPPRGGQEIEKIVNSLSIPIIAVGGITPENTEEVLQTGVGGIAVMSGIFTSCNALHTAEEYRKVLQKQVRKHGQIL